MAIVTTDDSHYKAIADVIRDRGGDAVVEIFEKDTFTPSEMADAVGVACDTNYDEGVGVGYDDGFATGIEDGFSEGYSTGHAEGFDEGKAEGITEGIQTEYDRFWGVYQQNGNRTSYVHAFRGEGWTQETFRPKYDLILSGANDAVFQMVGFVGDLAQHFEDLGVTFDTSKATSLSSLFNSATSITRIGVVDITNAPSSNSLFAYFYGHTIDKVIAAANNGWNYQFQSCKNLENLTIEGVIGTSGLNVQWSTKLTHDSLMSIINALQDKTSVGGTWTITIGATNKAKLTTDELKIAENKGWTVN